MNASEAVGKLRKGPCIAFDEGGNELAWMLISENGEYVPYNDEGHLYVITQIGKNAAQRMEAEHGA